MNQPLLSILIPTVVGREREIDALLWGNIQKQVDFTIGIIGGNYVSDPGPVEVFWCCDNKEMTIGEKREHLYSVANGIYSWQIDDDDDISPDAIRLILDAVKWGTDCITFKEKCVINGKYYSSDHQLQYDDWAENVNGFDYVRTPFYKDVIKTEIAKSVPFEHIRYGEDHAWARALKPHLKTSYYINQELYYYIHNSKPEDHNERYGIV